MISLFFVFVEEDDVQDVSSFFVFIENDDVQDAIVKI